MAARVIHVGADICHRLAVLENAGYQVDRCISVPELRSALSVEKPLDAVLISEGTDGVNPNAVLLARTVSSAPIVLFRETQLTVAESSFDLVVPILVPPQIWLEDIAELIARSRSLRATAQTLCDASAELVRASQAVRAQSRKERQRARDEYGKNIVPPDGLVRGPESDS